MITSDATKFKEIKHAMIGKSNSSNAPKFCYMLNNVIIMIKVREPVKIDFNDRSPLSKIKVGKMSEIFIIVWVFETQYCSLTSNITLTKLDVPT